MIQLAVVESPSTILYCSSCWFSPQKFWISFITYVYDPLLQAGLHASSSFLSDIQSWQSLPPSPSGFGCLGNPTLLWVLFCFPSDLRGKKITNFLEVGLFFWVHFFLFCSVPLISFFAHYSHVTLWWWGTSLSSSWLHFQCIWCRRCSVIQYSLSEWILWPKCL